MISIKNSVYSNEEIRQELTVAVESRSWNEMLMFRRVRKTSGCDVRYGWCDGWNSDRENS